MYAGAGLRGEEGWKCLVEGEEVVAQEGDVSLLRFRGEDVLLMR